MCYILCMAAVRQTSSKNLQNNNNRHGQLPLKAASGRRFYRAPELMRLARMTRAQVSYWETKGLVVPLRRGQAQVGKAARLYSPTEVLKAALISEMKHRGLSFQQVQIVIKNLEGHGL